MDFNQLLNRGNAEKMRGLADRLAHDEGFRVTFTRDPGKAIAELGITPGAEIKLRERDRVLIELFSDPKINELYLTGQVDELRDYILERHERIVGTSLGEIAGVAVADFDVAIEAEVVAVAVVAVAAVAIGALDPAERLRLIEADSGVLNARVEALDARLRMLERLENRISALESRVP